VEEVVEQVMHHQLNLQHQLLHLMEVLVDVVVEEDPQDLLLHLQPVHQDQQTKHQVNQHQSLVEH
jgi:hypothetical protein